MQYRGHLVLLDNFRVLYKDYSVDVQDVIRSAVLDGVDISGYVNACKDDPFRLDQIRLCLKEGISELEKLSKYSGDVMYGFRRLKKQGKNVKQFTDLLNSSSLSSEHIKYLLKWVGDGRKVDNLNIQTIPKDSLQVFDMGISLGLDMTVYNTGKKYADDLLRRLFLLQKKGRDVKPYLANMNIWSYDVIDYLVTTPDGVYTNLVNYLISSTTSLVRVKMLADLLKFLSVDECKGLVDKEVWSIESLSVLLKGLSQGISSVDLLKCNGNINELNVKLGEGDLNSRRKISGKLLKG